MDLYDRWGVLIPILAGSYGFLLALGILPRNPKDPQKMEEWRQKFGPMMKILCPIIIVFGILGLTGILK